MITLIINWYMSFILIHILYIQLPSILYMYYILIFIYVYIYIYNCLPCMYVCMYTYICLYVYISSYVYIIHVHAHVSDRLRPVQGATKGGGRKIHSPMVTTCVFLSCGILGQQTRSCPWWTVVIYMYIYMYICICIYIHVYTYKL